MSDSSEKDLNKDVNEQGEEAQSVHFEHADTPLLPPAEVSTELMGPQDAEKMKRARKAKVYNKEETKEFIPAAKRMVPPMLSWVLGLISLLLFLVSAGMMLCHFWADLPAMAKVLSLMLIPALLWIVYVIGYIKGYRAPELAALLAAISWLDAVLIFQFCIQTQPLWIISGVLALGMLLIPAIKPWKMAVYSVILATIIQFILMGWDLTHATTYGEWTMIWSAALSMMMIWIHIGMWCSITKRPGYADYKIINPIAQALFMLMMVTMLVYPKHLLPIGIDESSTVFDWFTVVLIWCVALLPVLGFQRHFAKQNGSPMLSWSFLLYWGISMVTVPVGLVLAWYSPSLLILPLSIVYLFSMVYYGAVYKIPRFVLMGSIGVFLTMIAIPYHAETGLIGSSIIMLSLSFLFLFAMLWLNTYRKLIEARPEEKEECTAITRTK